MSVSCSFARLRWPARASLRRAAQLGAALALLPVAPAFAQSPPTVLGTTIITGTREPQPLERSTADVVAISAETIRNSSADSVVDLLRREVGLQSTRNGGPGQTSGFLLRGMNTNGTLVLVDGVRVGSASLGQAEFESLSLAQIDHIEVLRGPGSSLYGADAVGGVVQIFTRRGDGAVRVTGGASVGGYRSHEGDLGVSGSSGGFDYAAMAGRERSRGTSALLPNDRFGQYNPDDDGYRLNFGNLKLGFTPVAGHRIGINLIETRLNAQFDGSDCDASFNCSPAADFRTRLTTRIASLDYRGTISSLWTTSLQLAHNLDDSTSGGATPSRFKTRREQFNWQNALQFTPDQQLVLAYDYLHDQLDADGFDASPKRSNHGVVAGYAGRFGASSVEASLRHDHNSVYGNNTTGSLGVGFEVGGGVKLRARAGTSFRAPSFNDLYYPFFGIATLQAERARSVEFGAEWRAGTGSASATVYRNRVKNLIGYDPDPNGTDCPAGFFGCAANIGRAVLTGATLRGTQRIGGLTLQGRVDLLDAKDADTGVRLPRRAAHQESLDVDYDLGAWSAGLSAVGVGSRPDGGVDLGGYATLDLRAAWRFTSQWRLEAKLLNALDHRIEPVRDYQGLGRQAWIGVRYDGAGLQ